MQSGYSMKAILVGSTRTGKTNIISRFIENNFSDEHQSTLGVEFASKNIEVNGEKIQLDIWDTASQEAFRRITRVQFRRCAIALIIFDVTQRQSFNEAHDLLEEIRSSSENAVILLVGNKSDLLENREVSTDEAREFCSSERLSYFESSAKNNIGINEMFLFSARAVLDNLENGEYTDALENSGIKRLTLDG